MCVFFILNVFLFLCIFMYILCTLSSYWLSCSLVGIEVSGLLPSLIASDHDAVPQAAWDGPAAAAAPAARGLHRGCWPSRHPFRFHAALVHPGRLRPDLCLHHVVPGALRRLRGHLRHAAAGQERVVCRGQRGAVQRPGSAGAYVAPAHDAHRPGQSVRDWDLTQCLCGGRRAFVMYGILHRTMCISHILKIFATYVCVCGLACVYSRRCFLYGVEIGSFYVVIVFSFFHWLNGLRVMSTFPWLGDNEG